MTCLSTLIIIFTQLYSREQVALYLIKQKTEYYFITYRIIVLLFSMSLSQILRNEPFNYTLGFTHIICAENFNDFIVRSILNRKSSCARDNVAFKRQHLVLFQQAFQVRTFSRTHYFLQILIDVTVSTLIGFRRQSIQACAQA